MYRHTDNAKFLYKGIKLTIQFKFSTFQIQFEIIFVLHEQAVGPLQEEHGAPNVQESKTKSMKLSI